MRNRFPHVLGVDDGPFAKGQREPVPVIAVLMEGAGIVEGVSIRAFPVDGEGVTAFLGDWILGLRWHATLDSVVLGGITLAGLAVVDVMALADRLGVPVLAVTRRDTRASDLDHALRQAGFGDRLGILEGTPAAARVHAGLYVACAGIGPEDAAAIVRATTNKARVPEPLRVAHLIGAAIVRGESKGKA